VVVGKLLAGRTNINVLLSHIAEVLFAKATFRLNAGGHRLRERYYDAGLVAGEYFRTAVVAAIGNGFELVDAKDFLRLASDVGELCSVLAVVRPLMRDDQVMFRIDCDLHIIADSTRAASAGRHRAAVGIGERDLLIG